MTKFFNILFLYVLRQRSAILIAFDLINTSNITLFNCTYSGHNSLYWVTNLYKVTKLSEHAHCASHMSNGLFYIRYELFHTASPAADKYCKLFSTFFLINRCSSNVYCIWEQSVFALFAHY